MGSSNFQLFNPTISNQETDAAYTADSLRSGGIQVDDILPSPFLNKIWYQAVTGVYALMQMMKNKGFTVSDANPATLAATLANILTTADIKAPLQTVSFSPTLTFNCAVANGFYVVLYGNIASLALATPSIGQIYSLAFQQQSAGNYTVAFPSNVLSPGNIAGTVGKTSIQQFQVMPDGLFHPIGPMVVS